jgi:hypothetical protein
MPSRFAVMRLALLLILLSASGLVRAGEEFQAAPIGPVTIRTLPAYTTVEAEETGSLDTAWTKGFRLGARYAAYANSGLNTPAVLTFPDWDKQPSAEGDAVHLLVDIILDPLPNLPQVHDPGAIIVQMPAMTVACCAHSGGYTPENFQQCLQKIQDYLRAQKIMMVGPPRYLYYTDTYWVPNWWRVGEVQVPIAPGAWRN